MSRILLVEDDPLIGKGVKLNLELDGYAVTWVQCLRDAFEANAKESFNLVLLDLGLPDGNGLTFCEKLRAGGSRLPVVMLTAQVDEDSVVAGLSAGASDYIRKPFGQKELMARIKNILREPVSREDQIRFGEVLLLRDQRRALFGSTDLELNRREYDIFLYLVEHGGAVVTRENIMNRLDKDGEIFDRTLDSHVSHIRAKLKGVGASGIKIASVYGVGYRLEKQ
jgi:DNA-binding response OmpR family regulator